METKIKKYFFGLLLLELLISYSPAFAQQFDYAKNGGVSNQIKQYLCAPSPVDPSQQNFTSGDTQGLSQFQQNAAANNANQADLYKCINRLYRFSIIFAAVVGVFFIVIGGYVYMGSEGNQESVDKAKSILTSTIASLIILLTGYILLKAINPDLIQFQNIQPRSVRPTSPLPAPVLPQPGAVLGSAQQLASQILSNSNIDLADSHVSGVSDNATAKNNIQDTAAGKPASRSAYQGAPGGTVVLSSSMLAALQTIGNQYKISVSEIAGGSHSANSNHYKGNAFDINYVNGSHLNSSSNQYVKPIMDLCKSLGASEVLDETSSANHIHCGDFSGTQASSGGGAVAGAYCEANFENCSLPCAYDSEINTAAAQFPITGLNTAVLIKAVMINESKCSPTAASSAGSYGIMQMQVSTAEGYKSGCTTDTIDQAWLTNPANAAKSICIGANYLQSLSKQCSGVLNIVAAYNGGPKACEQSKDCTGTSCTGNVPIRAWECPYDNPEHTIPNTGYNESRNYAPKVLGCYQTYTNT